MALATRCPWHGADCLINAAARACALVAMVLAGVAVGDGFSPGPRTGDSGAEPVSMRLEGAVPNPPEPYLSPWYVDRFAGEGNPIDGNHPGETTSPTLALAERATARAASIGGSLTEAEMRAVLAEAGFDGTLLEEALRVAWGESRWSPYAVGDSGRARGLFQLHADPWARYCGIAPEALHDARENAKCALMVLGYEQSRGYQRWANWSVKP